MPQDTLLFDHIHLVSKDPEAAAQWYVDTLGAEIRGSYTLRGAPQISVALGGVTLLIRGQRSGEEPESVPEMRDFDDYSSHNVWGVDHFGLAYRGDLRAFCDTIKTRGAKLEVEPWEFSPGSLICYVAAPDGVSIEIVQSR